MELNARDSLVVLKQLELHLRTYLHPHARELKDSTIRTKISDFLKKLRVFVKVAPTLKTSQDVNDATLLAILHSLTKNIIRVTE
jgi:hypothetical protein